MRNMSTGKKILLVVLLITGTLGIVACGMYIAQKYTATTTSPPPLGKISGKESQVTVTGKMICLAHKDTSGPVDAMCAIGLDGDDGKNYALGSDDPAFMSGVPTGASVKVTGTFTEQASRYDAAGTIRVIRFERL